MKTTETGGPMEPERYELAEPPSYTFELERREFLRVFGAGLAVAVTLPPLVPQTADAQGRPQPSNELAAWLHIDERGDVTVYTGKTEIGQNIRTSLAQVVADELRLPLDAVTMVMADTDRVPYDAGTFGSQSTPRMSRQLSRAAATAREMLVDQAAAQWKVERGTIRLEDGRLSSPDGRAATFGELTRGQKLTGTVADEPPVTPRDGWVLRGTSPKKVNGRAFVTGTHEFTPDVERPGMLHGVVVRPPVLGATPAAAGHTTERGAGGVITVRDGDFVGVVAPTERAARRAAAAVRVDWREPTGARPSSKNLYEHLRRSETSGGGRGSTPQVTGDVDAALRGAARIFEASYRIPYIAHVPMEPRAAVAEWTQGRLTVWTATQRPFGVRAELASAFRIPEAQVRVVVPDTGSAYGGKHTGEHAIEAARLARAARSPVKLVWTRAEEFMWGYMRPAGLIEVKAGVDANGTLVAWEFHNWNSGGSAIRTPYDVPNQRIAYHPSDSPLRQGSYRGLAATANHYVREMHMDAIARALEADPVEFRLRHLSDERMRAVLTAAAKKAGRPASGRALGIACGTEKGSYIATAAELSKADGGFRVERIVAAFECGAIVNPDGLLNQVEGCLVQGLGGALFEAIAFEDGRLLNGTLADYPVPRFRDVPPMEIELLDRRDLPSAGAGETPIVCIAPAIGSAARAFGPVETELPVRIGQEARR